MDKLNTIKDKVKEVKDKKQILSFQKVLLITTKELRRKIDEDDQLEVITVIDAYDDLKIYKFTDCECVDFHQAIKNCKNVSEWVKASYPVVITDDEMTAKSVERYVGSYVEYV